MIDSCFALGDRMTWIADEDASEARMKMMDIAAKDTWLVLILDFALLHPDLSVQRDCEYFQLITSLLALAQ